MKNSMKNFRDYGGLPIGEFDSERMERLHNIVFELYSEFEGSEEVRSLVFSYKLPEGPATFRTLSDNVFLRRVVSLSLDVLDYATGLIRKPVIAIPKTKILTPAEAGIVFPGVPEASLELRTDTGVDVERVEALQENCRRNPAVIEEVDKYKKALESAFEEFNLKFVLNGLVHHREQYFDRDRPIRKLQEKINQAWDRTSYTGLDNLYYNHARRFMRDAEMIWAKLDSTDLGKFFILQREELLEGLRS